MCQALDQRSHRQKRKTLRNKMYSRYSQLQKCMEIQKKSIHSILKNACNIQNINTCTNNNTNTVLNI